LLPPQKKTPSILIRVGPLQSDFLAVNESKAKFGGLRLEAAEALGLGDRSLAEGTKKIPENRNLCREIPISFVDPSRSSSPISSTILPHTHHA
jgi:hypothetical protein